MADYSNKKLLLLYILKILEEYSDEDHPLVSQQIISHLENDYNITCERKAISRNISCLLEAGYDIATYDENREGYFLRERIFEDAELRLLIDGILTSRHIPEIHANELINKLKEMTSKYSRKRLKPISTISGWQHSHNTTLFFTIDCLSEAIDKGKKVQFTYNELGIDKKLHPRHIKPYIINPYEIVSVYGRYYLICNYDKYENLANYRLDKITDIKILNDDIKPINNLSNYTTNFDLAEYIRHSIHMLGGKVIKAELLIEPYLIGDMIDWFGEDVVFNETDSSYIRANVTCTYEGLKYWAMQYLPNCEVVKPLELRNDITTEIQKAGRKYE